jgi:hypothetical protein
MDVWREGKLDVKSFFGKNAMPAHGDTPENKFLVTVAVPA